jgi:predicted RNA binding protein YcfA (HicA-like mRNA interferase family)
VTSREVLRILKRLGCVELRQKGSHKFIVSPCGKCVTTVTDHPGDMRKGTLHKIEKDMAPCLGNNWLARSK